MNRFDEYSPFVEIPAEKIPEKENYNFENVPEAFIPFQNIESGMYNAEDLTQNNESSLYPAEKDFEWDEEELFQDHLINYEFSVSPDKGITDYLNVSALGDKSLKTGIFIPSFYRKSERVDIVVYLHGLFADGDKENGIEYYWKNYTNIREYFYRSFRNGILIAPTLSSNPQKTDVILNQKGGLDRFLTLCLKALQYKNYIPSGSTFNKIIIAAHSAGGKPLSIILSDNGTFNQKIIESWGFDCLYSGIWAKNISSWARGDKKFYHYWAWSCSAKNIENCPRVIGDKIVSNPNVSSIAPSGKINHQQIIENAWLHQIINRTWFEKISEGASLKDDKPAYVPDILKAVRLNSYYSRSLGWNKYYDKINDLLLPYSGLQNVSLGEKAFAEAVVVWQRQNGFSIKDSDGIIGPNTWEKMQRYIFAANPSPKPPALVPVDSSKFNFTKFSLSEDQIIIQKKDNKNHYSEIKQAPAVFLKEIVSRAGEDPDRWFERFTRITFLGRSLKSNQYVQENFAIHLKNLEKKLSEKFGGPAADPAVAGDTLKLSHEGIAGSRLVSSTAAFSYHMFGLAVDINYTGSPYIQAHDSFNNFMAKAAKLVVNKEIEGIKWGMSIPASPEKYLKLYDDLSGLNDYLKKYFSFLENQNEPALNLSLKKCSFAPWNGLNLNQAKEIIKTDLKEISGAWKGSRNNPEEIFKNGFLGLSREFVNGMVESGLDWGGRYGDIMHFDMRTVPGIGSKIEKAKNQYIAGIKAEARKLYSQQQKETYYVQSYPDEFFSFTAEQDQPEDYSSSSEDFLPDLSKAVKLNSYYADKLGWKEFYDRINDLLLPYAGLQNVSLGEEAFAQAVAGWQKQQGFPDKDCDGIIGPNTWGRMKKYLNLSTPSYKPADKIISSAAPSIEDIPSFNSWYAQKILDAMNAGIAGSNFNAKDQLENIAAGKPVLNVDPNKKIIQILPIIYHIVESAGSENYKDIIIGSFIRKADDNGSCTGHCEGRCIDLNFKGGSFENPDSTMMVIKILQYLNFLPSQFKKNLGFGMPLQGEFFGHQNFKKYKSVDSSNLINPELRNLVFHLGYVFPDNNNHLHIQVRWNTDNDKIKHEDLLAGLHDENEAVQYMQQENLLDKLFDNYTLAYKLDKVSDWLPLLIFKVDDDLVAKLKSRNMYVQYAHNESYSNDLNTDFYRLRIIKYPVLNGILMNAQSLITYIRLNINNLVDTDLCDFYPYDAVIDAPVWQSDNPKGAVLKLDIKGPDNASVVVSLAKPNGWRFTTVHTPATGAHPVSGNREFFIAKDPAAGGTYFVIKGLDMMSTGIAGLGLPFFGGWGFGQADALWKSMRSKIVKLINENGGEAAPDITYSERVEWRFVYYRYKNLLEAAFGKGAGSPENSPFFDTSEVAVNKAYI